MLSQALWCAALVTPVTIVLQGCGGGSTTTPSSPTPAPTPLITTTIMMTTTTTTTTTVVVPRTPGWDAATALESLNKMYMDFDPDNDTSMVGVTISLASQLDSFAGNLFCAPLMHTECYAGQTDCRMSAAIYNHRVIVSSKDTFAPAMDRPIGYVFNQTLVETYFGKCSYIFDGATSGRVNNGCGTGASGPAECTNPNCAFNDMCYLDPPAHKCQREDKDIQDYLCKCEAPICDETYGVADPPLRDTDAQCFYEMPAMYLDPENPSNATVTPTNHLRDSLKQRVVNQQDYDDQMQKWNEVVIDDRLLIPEIIRDPTHTILAFVYIIGENAYTEEQTQNFAETMRDEFQSYYHVNGVGNIPVIGIDLSLNFTEVGGPFVLPSSKVVDRQIIA